MSFSSANKSHLEYSKLHVASYCIFRLSLSESTSSFACKNMCLIAIKGSVECNWQYIIFNMSPQVSFGRYMPCGEVFELIPLGKIGRHFSDEIFWWIFMNENFLFWLKFHWNLFVRVQLTISQHWFIYKYTGQAIIWTNTDPIHWRIHAALGEDQFNDVNDVEVRF